MTNYKGCKIELVKDPKSDMTGLGDDWVITDIDGVSVGGFRSEAEAKRWCDQHTSRCANSSARNSINPVVQKAMNSAFTDFGLFKDYKTYATMELSALLPKFNEVGHALKREAEISKRGTTKKSEQDYIDTCLSKCLAALKEAHDRIQKQTNNVMQ